jgi:hypothetical protein
MLAGWVPLYAAAVTWNPVAAGVEHLRVTEGGMDCELIRFDLARFAAEVVVLGPDRPRTAAALREEMGGSAAVNGGFFDEDWRPLGLRIMSGKTMVALRPRVDWGVLFLRRGRARIVHSREFRPDPTIEQAIQVGPRLVVDGQPLRLKPQVARRTAVALDREGRWMTLIATHAPADAMRLAELLVQLGFDSAVMFDGGPSSQLSAALGDLHLELRGGYAVPDVLLMRPR